MNSPVNALVEQSYIIIPIDRYFVAARDLAESPAAGSTSGVRQDRGLILGPALFARFFQNFV